MATKTKEQKQTFNATKTNVARAKKEKLERQTILEVLSIPTKQRKEMREVIIIDEEPPDGWGKEKSKNLIPLDLTGRPTVMTNAVLAKLEYAFKIDCTIEHACTYAGIHQSTYQRFCKRNPHFCELAKEWKSSASVFISKHHIAAAAQRGDLAINKWILETKKETKGDYSRRVEHTGDGGGAIKHHFSAELDKRVAKYEEAAIIEAAATVKTKT